MGVDEKSLQAYDKDRCQYLWSIAKQFQNLHPQLSRFYVTRMQRIVQDKSFSLKKHSKNSFCHYCGSMWTPDNHTVRIHKKPALSKRIITLLKRQQNRSWLLTKRDKKLLKAFNSASNKVVYHCLSCNKSTKTANRSSKEDIVEDNNNNNKAMFFDKPSKKKKKKKNKENCKACKAGLKICCAHEIAVPKKMKKKEGLKVVTIKTKKILSPVTSPIKTKTSKQLKIAERLKVRLRKDMQKKDLLNQSRALKVFLEPLPDLWLLKS